MYQKKFPSNRLGTPCDICFVLISISNILFNKSDNKFWILFAIFLSVRTNLALCPKQSDWLIRFVKVRKIEIRNWLLDLMNSLLTRHKLEQEVYLLTNRVINLPTYDPKSKMQSGCNHCILAVTNLVPNAFGPRTNIYSYKSA